MLISQTYTFLFFSLSMYTAKVGKIDNFFFTNERKQKECSSCTLHLSLAKVAHDLSSYNLLSETLGFASEFEQQLWLPVSEALVLQHKVDTPKYLN